MSDLYMNNEKLNIDLNQFSNLDDLVAYLEREHYLDDKVVADIKFDKKSVLNMSERLGSDLPQRIDLRLISRKELAIEALQSCTTYIDAINQKIGLTISRFQDNNLDLANVDFTELVEWLNLFVELQVKVFHALQDGNKEVPKPATIRSLEMNLLSILRGILQAKEKGDTIMLCDLLRYELKENLIQWKIKGIPEMRLYPIKNLP